MLGADVAIDIDARSTRPTPRVRLEDIIAHVRRHDGFGMVGLVGVQSNQFPRALDIARPFRAAGVPVVIGGFHVSGCSSMLPEMQADVQEALDIGCSLFAGEAEEGRLEEVLQRRRRRHAEADLQFHGRPAGLESDADAVSAAQTW